MLVKDEECMKEFVKLTWIYMEMSFQNAAPCKTNFHSAFMKSLILYSSDGAGKSGLFSALYDIINRMAYDRMIDIYMTVRQVQSIIPQALTSVVSGHLQSLYLTFMLQLC